MQLMTTIAYSKILRVIAKPDILVCGTGLAGIGAAVAAARNGASVMAVDRMGFAGGFFTNVIGSAFDGGGLLLSSVRYLSASGDPIHRAGVEPAVVAQPPVAEFGTELGVPAEDPMLDSALEHLADIPAA